MENRNEKAKKRNENSCHAAVVAIIRPRGEPRLWFVSKALFETLRHGQFGQLAVAFQVSTDSSTIHDLAPDE